jgi:hypothetical protein
MMVWPQEKLRTIAEETAKELDGQCAGLRATLAKVSAELETASRALDRAAVFKPSIDGKEQCPECWVREERASGLIQIEGAHRTDNYRCLTCKRRFALSY